METSILKEVSPVDQTYDKEEQSGFDSESQVALLMNKSTAFGLASTSILPEPSFIGQ